MAKTRILSQPYGETLGEFLNEIIIAGEYDELNIVVAFAKSGGVSILRNAISEFKTRGGTVNFYVGFDLGGTSIEALEALYALADNLYLLHSSSNQTFHPKIYDLRGNREAVVIVGSSNLTGGGLRTNAESSLIAFLALDDDEDRDVQAEVDDYLRALRAGRSTCMKIESESELEKLHDDGMVPNEADIRKSPPNCGEDDGTEQFAGLFGRKSQKSTGSTGNGHAAAEAPWFQNFQNADRIWIETGRGTGGSNNQLDLSMSAVIAPGDPGNEFGKEKKSTGGSVLFFGVDPEATNKKYRIEIRYNGRLYEKNEIKIYKGATQGAKPNGTWRLYLCGTCDGSKLSKELNDTGIAGKLAVFTKCGKDRYLLDFCEESMITDYRARSTIVAHNSRRLSNRAFGLMPAIARTE